MVRGANKDKNRPKGPMSAYACFVQVIREEHKKKHPEEQVIFSEFSKKCAEKWKQMTSKEKKRFDDMAAMDKDRYNREMNDYIPPDGIKKGKKRKRPKDPNMPKRSWSAFFFFCDEFRPQVREAHNEWKVGDIAKELGKMWEICPDKYKYEAKATADKKRYEEDMEQFKAGTYVVPVKKPKPEIEVADDEAGPSAADHDDEEEEEEEDLEEDDSLAHPPAAQPMIVPSASMMVLPPVAPQIGISPNQVMVPPHIAQVMAQSAPQPLPQQLVVSQPVPPTITASIPPAPQALAVPPAVVMDGGNE